MSIRLTASLASLFALGAVAAAQNARTPEFITTSGSSGVGSAIATAGDLSVLVTVDYTADELHLRTSDGRGLEWSAPVRIDEVPGVEEYLSADCIGIVDDRVYVSYADSRFGMKEVFVRSYDVGAGTLSPEVRVPNTYAPGEAATFSWDMETVAGTTDDHVYFIIAVDIPSPNIERARFVASHDGGATFPIDRQMTPANADLDSAYQIEAADGILHIAWSDSRNSAVANDVFYQRSFDGGLSFLPADVQLDASGPGIGDAVGIGFHLAVAPPLVGLGWIEDITSPLHPEVHAIVSMDNGLTWGPDQKVNQGPAMSVLGFTQVAVIADPDSNSVAVGWNDARFGGLEKAELFAATTFDGGNTWNESQLSNTGILGVIPERHSTHEADGRTWMSFGYSGYYTGEVYSALSVDGGATWEPSVHVVPSPVPNSASIGQFTTNALYGNRIHTWAEGSLFGSLDVYVGGYRVPTLDYVPSSGAPGLNFEMSEMGSAAFGAVLISGGTGTLPVGFGDARDLGLAVDAWLLASAGEAFGVLGGSLTNGAGSTPFLPAPLPPGLGLHAAAVSFDIAGSVAIGEITDVQILP